MRHLPQLLLGTLLALSLTACSTISPGNQTQINYLRLDRPMSEAAPGNVQRYGMVKIDLPTLYSSQAPDAILYAESEHELNAYSKSQWAVPLPMMVQEWLMQGIEESGLFQGVMRTSSRAQASYLVESDILRFEHRVPEQQARIALRVTLLDIKQRRILHQKLFRYQGAMETQSASGAVSAFNRLMQQFSRDLVDWLATAG